MSPAIKALVLTAFMAAATSPTIGGLAARATIALPLQWAGIINPATADTIALKAHW